MRCIDYQVTLWITSYLHRIFQTTNQRALTPLSHQVSFFLSLRCSIFFLVRGCLDEKICNDTLSGMSSSFSYIPTRALLGNCTVILLCNIIFDRREVCLFLPSMFYSQRHLLYEGHFLYRLTFSFMALDLSPKKLLCQGGTCAAAAAATSQIQPCI